MSYGGGTLRGIMPHAGVMPHNKNRGPGKIWGRIGEVLICQFLEFSIQRFAIDLQDLGSN